MSGEHGGKKSREFHVVNHSVPREDGFAKVTGRAVYASDIRLDGMAYAKVARSPYAHARIVSMNVAEAARQPGVLAVLTGDDLQGIDPYYGHAVKDHPLLAIGKVRFLGEPVAAVVAETERAAYEALEFIETEYEELPTVLDVDQALAESAPLVHQKAYSGGAFRGFEDDKDQKASNICQNIHFEWGDVDAAFEQAAHVIEGEYYFPMAYAYAMEPYVSVADYTASGLTVYSSAQHPFIVRHDLSKVFGLPLNRVRLIVPFIGGGYGSKSYTKVEPLTAACSWKTKRPVKLQLSVEEAMLTIRNDDARVRIRTAVDAEGRLLAREAMIHLNTGAYAENSPLVAKKAANRIIGPYRFPNVRVDCLAVYTNTVPASSFRGFGATQVTFPGESQMDELAEKLKSDPVEFRQKNLAARGEAVHPNMRPLDADLAGDLSMIAEALETQKPLPANHGWGVACSASDAGSDPVTSSLIQVYGDGSVSVLTGSTEMGQGSHTVLRQIAAEEMGAPLEKVRVVGSDTAISPFERSTGASRTTTLMGRAVLEACHEAIEQLKNMAAEVLKTTPQRLTVERGGVAYQDQRLTWPEILNRYFGMSGCSIVGRAYLRRVGDLCMLPVFWEIGCAGVEVAVDPETGRIRLEKLATVGDVGLAINPAMAEGQDLGAATMGLGIGLYEELTYEGQQLLNGNLLDYRVPRFSDLAPKLELMLAENQDGVGPYGAKGGGEGSLNPIPACLANAVYRATGVRLRRLPLTPERVWRALKERAG
jgi:CO/xanthine dehydrogenase Mo-binding subunit